MEIQEIKIEFIDEDSRFVLKRIKTKDGKEFFNRKLAVCNSIYSCENDRITYGKPLFNSPFQTHHIGWDNKEEEWDFKGLTKRKKHALKNNRFFVPYKQRNENQWENLNWNESLKDVEEFKDKTKIVPFPIHLKSSFEEFKTNKQKTLDLLEEGQELMPIISTKHLNLNEFPLIVKNELKESKFFGICCYGVSDVIERRNLSYLNAINSSFNIGDSTALIFCFDYLRILKNHSYIAGCFAFNCFSGDVFSEKAYFPRGWNQEAFDNIMKKKPSNYPLYDIKEKKFTTSLPQKEWYGFDLTNNFMGQISVNEGLSGYKALKWINHHLQQKDLDLINELLISKRKVIDALKNYAGWNVFWDKTKPNAMIIQETLDF